MASPAPRRATYNDLLSVPSHLVAELIGCELHAQPRPGGPRAAAASILGMVVGNPFHRDSGGPGDWVTLDEPELHLGGGVLVPDLAGWRRERMPAIPDTAAFNLAPDWICEVLSPSTEAVDRTQKVPIYARERVEHVWLLNPHLHMLGALALDGSGYRVLGAWHGEQVVRVPPFDAVEIAGRGEHLTVAWSDRTKAHVSSLRVRRRRPAKGDDLLDSSIIRCLDPSWPSRTVPRQNGGSVRG